MLFFWFLFFFVFRFVSCLLFMSFVRGRTLTLGLKPSWCRRLEEADCFRHRRVRGVYSVPSVASSESPTPTSCLCRGRPPPSGPRWVHRRGRVRLRVRVMRFPRGGQ